MPSEHFGVLARHSAWANRRLYQACEGLSAAEYLRDRGSSFGSLHATLNRGVVADRIWIARIEGRTPAPLDDDQMLYADLTALKVARVAEDERWRHIVAGLDEAALDRPLAYADRRGDRFQTPLRLVLAHVFGEQARNRGEAQALLAQAGSPPPALDLLTFLGESGIAR